MSRTADDGPPVALIAAALKRERARHGIGLAELARRAGVAKSTLSQLEAGAGNPSLEVLWALSRALEIPFARLVEPDEAPVRLLRRGDGPRVASERSAYVATLLTTSPPGARADLYLLEQEPGEPRRSDPHTRGTVEHVVLSTGRALAGPADAPVELLPGDTVSYPGDVAHVFEALEPGTSAVLLSEQH